MNDYQAIETIRQTYAKKIKRFIIFPLSLCLIIAAATMVFILVAKQNTSMSLNLGTLAIIMFIAAAIAIIGVIITRKDAKNYKQAYKTYFVLQSLNQIFTNVQYDHSAGIPKDILRATEMIRLGSIYHSNDYVSAKYHDVAFRQADVDIKEQYTDSDGNTHYVTIFKGRWMIFEFPKPFTFRLQVIQKHFGASKKASKNRETGRKLKRISTESITFDKEFKVLAEDDFEAYYILDPAFIDHIEQLAISQKGKFMLCFKDNQLHVAIYDGKDAFEAPNPLKKIDETAEFAKIGQDIKTITSYIDFLKLDHKLFSRIK